MRQQVRKLSSRALHRTSNSEMALTVPHDGFSRAVGYNEFQQWLQISI